MGILIGLAVILLTAYFIGVTLCWFYGLACMTYEDMSLTAYSLKILGLGRDAILWPWAVYRDINNFWHP